MLADVKYEVGEPKIILLLSGKRKSGKDYVADFLLKRIGSERCAIIRLSGPLKKKYAKEHNLDFEKLLESSEYKEIFRLKMIKWGEEKRNKDPGFFCRLAIEQTNATSKGVWVVSDARRKSDIEYFLKQYPSITNVCRICASPEIRLVRGFTFTEGIDDCESECGLDSYDKFDFMINNDNDVELFKNLVPVIDLIKTRCSLTR